jgi:hypothetical protein
VVGDWEKREREGGRFGRSRFGGRFHKKRGSQAFHKRSEDQPKERKIFEVQVRVFVARQAMYTTNKRKAFALIYEQCNKTLQSKLKARANYDTEIKGNPIKMLQTIQE